MIQVRDNRGNYHDALAIYDNAGREIKEVRDNQGRLLFKNWNEIHGSVPLSFMSRGGYLKDYRIYGNTVQNGIPTPENPVEVQGCGERTENLFDASMIFEKGYINDEGDIEVANSMIHTRDYIPIKNSSQYVLTGKLVPIYIIASVAMYDAQKNFIARIRGGQAQNRIVFTTSDNCSYVRLNVNDGYQGFHYDPKTIMLIESSTAPENYIPYGYKIPVTVSDGRNAVTTPVYIGSEPLHKIGDYVDYVDFKRGVVVRNIKKIILTGDENWIDNTHNANQNVYRLENFINFRRFPNDAESDFGIFRCDHILYMTPPYPSSLFDRIVLAYVYYYQKHIIYFSTKKSMGFDTVTSFKNFLAEQYELGQPVTIWYIAAEPEEKPLGNLLPIQTIKGSDVLTAGTTVQPSEIYIKGKIKSIT